jgi:predicted SnoaL-like aldol condensation-catalyzing enzyme
VLSFYKEALIGRQPRSGFERYMSADFVEHKPDIAGGTREATVSYLEQLIKDVPDPRWEVLRTAAESDLVFLHATFTPEAGAPAYAVVDVFRLQNCLIVEHWDVVSAPREQKPNPHSRF